MNTIFKIWAFLSGKKTTISAVMFGVSQILTAVGQPEVAGSVTDVANYLLGIGMAHKIQKGVSK